MEANEHPCGTVEREAYETDRDRELVERRSFCGQVKAAGRVIAFVALATYVALATIGTISQLCTQFKIIAWFVSSAAGCVAGIWILVRLKRRWFNVEKETQLPSR